MDRLSHIQSVVMLNEESLEVVVMEGFVAKFNVLVANVCQDGRLGVQIVVEASLCYDTPLNVAEETTKIYG